MIMVLFVVILLLQLLPVSSAWRVCDVRQHGAKGDNRTKDTEAIKAAIAACNGGGEILLPAPVRPACWCPSVLVSWWSCLRGESYSRGLLHCIYTPSPILLLLTPLFPATTHAILRSSASRSITKAWGRWGIASGEVPDRRPEPNLEPTPASRAGSLSPREPGRVRLPCRGVLPILRGLP
jgi:hypothetical protein